MTAALGQAAFAHGSCQETSVTHSRQSQRQTRQTFTQLVVKVEMDGECNSKTFSCFPMDISRG